MSSDGLIPPQASSSSGSVDTGMQSRCRQMTELFAEPRANLNILHHAAQIIARLKYAGCDDGQIDHSNQSRSPTPRPTQTSPDRRLAWQRDALAEPERRCSPVFLHQSISTPCLNAIVKAEGIWVETWLDEATGISIATTSTISVTAIRSARSLRQVDELCFEPHGSTRPCFHASYSYVDMSGFQYQNRGYTPSKPESNSARRMNPGAPVSTTALWATWSFCTSNSRVPDKRTL